MTGITQAEAAALAAHWTDSNPFRAEAPAPSWAAMEQTLRQWHEQSLNEPEYLWMNFSFEDMADAVTKAMFCTGEPRDMTPDDGWMARQDVAS